MQESKYTTNPTEMAFPGESDWDKETGARTIQHGLSKREYFAAKAMQGLCTDNGISVENTASLAVKIADSLIAELNK